MTQEDINQMERNKLLDEQVKAKKEAEAAEFQAKKAEAAKAAEASEPEPASAVEPETVAPAE